LSYRALNPGEARLFRLLGLHSGPDISAPAAASLAGLPLADVRPLLAELTRAHLVSECSPGRYACHDLLRAYAAWQSGQIDSDGDRHAAVHRVLDHYLHNAHAADKLLDPSQDLITLAPPQPGVTPEVPGDHEQALAWFTAEHVVLLTAVDRADPAWDTHTWQPAWTLWNFLDRRGFRHDQAATQRAALAAASRLGDPLAQAYAHRSLARACAQQGCLDDSQAHLRQSLDLYGQAQDQAGQGLAHLNLAIVCGQRGRDAQALHHSQQALGLLRAAGHRRGQARSLNNIGWYHAQLGDYQQALLACRQVIVLHRELDDQQGQAGAWDSLGYAYHHLGQHDHATACYQRALRLYRQIGDRCYEADTLTHIGDTCHAAHDPGSAREAWQQALTILDDLDHPDAGPVRAKIAALDAAADRSPGLIS